jgi:hypothetical protein
MSNNSDKQDPLAHACELVGRFLYHFGRVERKIDQAVIKLLDLSERRRMTSAAGCTRSTMTERLLLTPTSTLLQVAACSLIS